MSVLERIDAFCDEVPRAAGRVEELGALRVFVRGGPGWPYYARPVPGAAPGAADVAAARRRQRELGEPEALEWIHDLVPGLLDVVRGEGMQVLEAPLMVLGADVPPRPAPPPGVTVRMLEPGDPAVAASAAVSHIGFRHPGTAVGGAGPAERDAEAARQDPDEVELNDERMRRGLVRRAVAEDAGGVLAAGAHQQRGPVSEIVGVATLPSARRRGLGALVTGALVDDAREQGAELVFLSAGSEEIARVYARLGFERVGTSCIAEPA